MVAVDLLCIVPSWLFLVSDCGAIESYGWVGLVHRVFGFAVDSPGFSAGKNVLSVRPLISLQRWNFGAKSEVPRLIGLCVCLLGYFCEEFMF